MAPRFEDLIERYHDEIFSYLWRLLGKQRRAAAADEAGDVTQEVFLRAYRAFPALRRDSNYRAWLYKIATRCAWTHLRQLKRREDATLAFSREAVANFDAHRVGSCKSARLSFLLSELPPKQRACVTLRYFHDLDYAEIAAIVRCTEESARANVYQAIRRLRMALEGIR